MVNCPIKQESDVGHTPKRLQLEHNSRCLLSVREVQEMSAKCLFAFNLECRYMYEALLT